MNEISFDDIKHYIEYVEDFPDERFPEEKLEIMLKLILTKLEIGDCEYINDIDAAKIALILSGNMELLNRERNIQYALKDSIERSGFGRLILTPNINSQIELEEFEQEFNKKHN